jgi:hypothetical protein
MASNFLVSPGVAIREVDNSQYATTTSTGNVTAIVGYTEKGPFTPTLVSSQQQYNKIFGSSLPAFPYTANAAYKYFNQGSSLLVVRAGNSQDPSMSPYAAQYTVKQIQLNPSMSTPTTGSQTFKYSGTGAIAGTPNTTYSFQVVADYDAFLTPKTVNEFKVVSAETYNDVYLDNNGNPVAASTSGAIAAPTPLVYNNPQVFKLAFSPSDPNHFTAYYKRSQNGNTDEYSGTGTRTGTGAFSTISATLFNINQNNNYVDTPTDTVAFSGTYQAAVVGTTNLHSGYDWSGANAASFAIQLGTTSKVIQLSTKATSVDDVVVALNNAFTTASISTQVVAFSFSPVAGTSYVGLKHLTQTEDGFTLVAGAGTANALPSLGFNAGVFTDENSVFGTFTAELDASGFNMHFAGMIVATSSKISTAATTFQPPITISVTAPSSGAWDKATLAQNIQTAIQTVRSDGTYTWTCSPVKAQAKIDVGSGKIQLVTVDAADLGLAIVSITSGVGTSLVGLLGGTDTAIVGSPAQATGQVLLTLQSAEKGSYGTKLALQTETKFVQTGPTTTQTNYNVYVYYNGVQVSNYQRVNWTDPTDPKYIATLMAKDAYLTIEVEDETKPLIAPPDATWSLSDNSLPTNVLSTQAQVVGFTAGTNGWVQDSNGVMTSMDSDFINALQLLSNPEIYDFNIVYAPPAFDTLIQNAIQALCESRRDCFGVVDAAPFGMGLSVGQNLSFVSEINDRNINLTSSYVAAYWPWLQDYDTDNNAYVWLPPSMYAVQQLIYTDNVADPWYATAGLTRGMIAATDIEYSPTSTERDILYGDPAIINPIIKLVNTGITIWGQKTAQRTDTATNRINVRRLLIYTEKLIAKMAKSFLFEPNDSSNWTAFARQANAILEPIRQANGLYTYSVVCDSTTNTSDLVNQNIMYGKIFVQPMKTIEMIQVDFTIDAFGAVTVSESKA